METARLKVEYNSKSNRFYGYARNGVTMLVLYGVRKLFPILAEQVKAAKGKCVDITISMEVAE